jgi:hypothetical protein
MEGVPMEDPVRLAELLRTFGRASCVVLLGTLLASCASVPRQFAPVALDTPAVEFKQGRLTIELVDEFGSAMAGYRVDFRWDAPEFYRTSSFTDRNGKVTFAGVPEVAAVSINHEGGLFEQTISVPQRGGSDMRVMVDTRGEYDLRLIREKEQLTAR